MRTVADLLKDPGWEDAETYTAGTLQKTLRDEDGAKTVILKLPAGFRMEPHSHITTEQDFILEGSYVNDGVTYSRGFYQIYYPHEDHGPFYSEEGATVLVIWDPYPAK